jgi:transcription elongation factor Elf1
MPIEAEFNCAYCGALNVTVVDAAGGHRQTYVEDCQICCKPNTLEAEVDPQTSTARLTARGIND